MQDAFSADIRASANSRRVSWPSAAVSASVAATPTAAASDGVAMPL